MCRHTASRCTATATSAPTPAPAHLSVVAEHLLHVFLAHTLRSPAKVDARRAAGGQRRAALLALWLAGLLAVGCGALSGLGVAICGAFRALCRRRGGWGVAGLSRSCRLGGRLSRSIRGRLRAGTATIRHAALGYGASSAAAAGAAASGSRAEGAAPPPPGRGPRRRRQRRRRTSATSGAAFTTTGITSSPPDILLASHPQERTQLDTPAHTQQRRGAAAGRQAANRITNRPWHTRRPRQTTQEAGWRHQVGRWAPRAPCASIDALRGGWQPRIAAQTHSKAA